MTSDRRVFLIKDIYNGTFIFGLILSSTDCWPIVGSLGKPLGKGRIGNGSAGKLLVNGRYTDDFNLTLISAVF